jgi:peptidoglycan/LPS O-acetylase OafA/YrhL
VAVLLVVLFHARVAGMTGGFVGVDVFFVLSGYLITGLLLREYGLSGRIDIVRFYARRAARILPAATATIVVTLTAAAFVVAPLDRSSVGLDAAAAALFVGNLRYAAAAIDYFGSGTPSPFQHFWSLGVEEQFYLAWPLLVLLRLRLGHLGRSVVVVGVLMTSLGLSLVWTRTDPVAAFYGLPTRAWELALGAALADFAAPLSRVPRRVRGGLGWVGLAALAVAAVLIDPLTPYPGVAALLPTGGVALVIIARGDAFSPASLLCLPPLRALGRVSYSLYLWHWPVLVLAEIANGRELAPLARWSGVCVSLLLAGISWKLIEKPLRRGGGTVARPRYTLSLGGSSVAVVAALALVFNASSGISGVAAAVSGPLAAGVTEAAPDLPMDPRLVWPAPVTSASERPAQAVVPSAGPLTPTVRAKLAFARRDADGLNERGCGLSLAGDRPPLCRLGSGSLSVALVGDSHAAQWFPLLEQLAADDGWTVLPFTKDSCPFLDLRVISTHLHREYGECAVWRERVIASLSQLRPDLVFVASSRWSYAVDPRENSAEQFGAAMARALARVPGRIVIVGDTPLMADDVPACLSRHVDEMLACATARDVALAGDHMVRDLVAAQLRGARVIDPTDWLCDAALCPAVIHGEVVYRDDHHLTATFVRSLEPLFAETLHQLIDQ